MKRTVFVILAVLLRTAFGQMTWTCATESAPWGSRSTHTSVVFHDTMWILGGSLVTTEADTEYNDVWYSTNGVNWTCLIESAPWRPRFGHASVVFNDKMWVLGGYYLLGGSYYRLNDVWWSSDGDSWVCATDSAQWRRRAYAEAVVFDDKIWVLAGITDGGDDLRDVWYSTDGANWTCATDSAPWVARDAPALVVYNSNMWLMGGGVNLSGVMLNDVWTSTDGAGWTCLADSAPWQPRMIPQVVVFDGKMWLSGGGPDPEQRHRLNDVWYSSKGDWTCAADSAEWLPRGGHTSLAFDGKIWILGAIPHRALLL